MWNCFIFVDTLTYGIRELYARILGITDPWRVDRVDLKLEIGEVHIILGHAPDLRWPCPECGALCALHDHQPERQWRHSGFHAYAGEEIPDIEDALRVGLYMVRGPVRIAGMRCVARCSRSRIRNPLPHPNRIPGGSKSEKHPGHGSSGTSTRPTPCCAGAARRCASSGSSRRRPRSERSSLTSGGGSSR